VEATPDGGDRGHGPARHRRRRRHRTWGQRLVLVLGCLSALGLAISAAGLAYVYRKYQRLPRVDLSGVLDETTEAGEPENYLVVGIESAEDLAPGDPVRIGRDGGRKSDTIMILRIDPEAQGARLLSIPRDLWVAIAGAQVNRKINAAVEFGGPRQLIRTIDQNFGITIQHYVEVDFAGFRDLVDAIDGVPVHFPRPARDRETGLAVDRTGCVTLGPVQALAYVRSRTYEQRIGGEWEREQNLPDLGRIERQQAFIRQALSRAIERGARNPGTLDQLIDVGIDNITVDQALTAGDLFDLGGRFRSFDPDTLETYSLDGVVTPDLVGEADVLRLDKAAADPILDLFRQQEPSQAPEDDLVPASVNVTVLNGTGRQQEAADAGADLEAAGFGVEQVGDNPVLGNPRTVVQHPPRGKAAADLVARSLVAGADLVPVEGSAGIVLITGSDWQGVRDTPRAPTTTTTGSSTATPSTTPSTGDGGEDGPTDHATTSSTNPAARGC
jgi:LCP family protein required for cell wall assembly